MGSAKHNISPALTGIGVADDSVGEIIIWWNLRAKENGLIISFDVYRESVWNFYDEVKRWHI